MPVTFAQLEKRTLTTKIVLSDEVTGNGEPEDYRIVFRDVSIIESRKLIETVAKELTERSKPAIELREKITKAYEDIADLAGKNGDSPKKIKNLEAKIAEYEKSVLSLPPVPTFQQLHLSKIVVDLPDQRGDNPQEVPPISVELFQRLPYNMTLGIDAAIGERVNRTGNDEKK